MSLHNVLFCLKVDLQLVGRYIEWQLIELWTEGVVGVYNFTGIKKTPQHHLRVKKHLKCDDKIMYHHMKHFKYRITRVSLVNLIMNSGDRIIRG